MHVRAPMALLTAAVVLLAGASSAAAAEPPSGTVGKGKDATWTGAAPVTSVPNPVAGCVGPQDPACDHFALTIEEVQDRKAVAVAVDGADGDDWDLYIYGPDGSEVASAATESSDEVAVLNDPAPGRYDVAVLPWNVADGARYAGSAKMSTEQFEPVDSFDCLEAVPAAAGSSGVTDFGQTVTLSVRVLLDGVSQARGNAVMQRAAVPYREAGVDLRWKLQSVSFSQMEGSALIDEARAHFDGATPRGVDVVYVLTSKDIYFVDIDGTQDDGLAGQADCIGGIRSPANAFAVGEDYANRGEGQVDPPFQLTDATGEIAAHEIGHLMGAHHHYANCAESASQVPGQPLGVLPCTLMFNYIDMTTLDTSTLNTAVIRGHAVQYASP